MTNALALQHNKKEEKIHDDVQNIMVIVLLLLLLMMIVIIGLVIMFAVKNEHRFVFVEVQYELQITLL